jgi:hypothetical protein
VQREFERMVAKLSHVIMKKLAILAVVVPGSTLNRKIPLISSLLPTFRVVISQ